MNVAAYNKMKEFVTKRAIEIRKMSECRDTPNQEHWIQAAADKEAAVKENK